MVWARQVDPPSPHSYGTEDRCPWPQAKTVESILVSPQRLYCGRQALSSTCFTFSSVIRHKNVAWSQFIPIGYGLGCDQTDVLVGWNLRL